MKIYICTDLEGVTGVYRFDQTRERGTPENLEAIRLLMGDIAAVAEGLKEAGVDEIYVRDGHGGGDNFIPTHMVPGVHYISGRATWGPINVLDESFDGAVLLGYHAMNGTADGVLHHTQSSKIEAKYFYDGVERGEIYQSAVTAGHYDVPVMLVTGDEAACREARELLGSDLPTVAVKQGIHREAAIMLAAEETRPLLIEGARKAVEALPQRKPFKIKLPVQVRVRRIAPQGSTGDNPYYVEREAEVDSQLNIIASGSE